MKLSCNGIMRRVADMSHTSFRVMPFAVSMLMVSTANKHAQTYSIEDLGTLTNRSSVGMAISNTGYVAGFSTISGNNNGEPWFNHAFRWYAGVMSDLGVLGRDVPPGTFPRPESQAMGMNGRGQVVGRSVQPGQPYQGFLW